MLRIELATQLRRVRTLILFGFLVGVPVLAGLTQASKSGGRHGGGAATFSALNFAQSGLNFMDPVLFGLVIAVIGSILGGADREWGTLRYLYVRPVSPRKLMAGKWWALVVFSALVVGVFLLAVLLTGLAAFGWHPYHRSGAGALSEATASWAVLGAGGYLVICLLSIGAIALALGLLLPRAVEALGISVAFVVGSAMIDNVRSLHWLALLLPVHYWLRWTELFDSAGSATSLVPGLAAQAAAAAVALTAAFAILSRRDPAG